MAADESLSVRAARHPSESEEYLVTRVLAYCLEYEEGIAFTKGVSDPNEPALTVRDLTVVACCLIWEHSSLRAFWFLAKNWSRFMAVSANTRPFNYLGLPTISIPCGFTGSGLPIGLQLQAPPFEEDRLLRGADWRMHDLAVMPVPGIRR